MNYISLVVVFIAFIFFLAILFSDLRGSLRSAIKSIPPDIKTSDQKRKERTRRKKEESKPIKKAFSNLPKARPSAKKSKPSILSKESKKKKR